MGGWEVTQGRWPSEQRRMEWGQDGWPELLMLPSGAQGHLRMWCNLEGKQSASGTAGVVCLVSYQPTPQTKTLLALGPGLLTLCPLCAPNTSDPAHQSVVSCLSL